MANVGNMAEEAAKRRERLRSMRGKQTKPNEGEEEPPGKKLASGEALPKPIFRSYKPQDEGLKEAVLPKAKPAEVVEDIREQLESGLQAPVAEEIDLTTLAPRKPDWDLKRDISKKLDKLERRTQRAIAELIRERLQSGQEDLVSAVGAAGAAQLQDED